MKKLLILMLVLGMTSLASAATTSLEFRDAAGTSVISVVDVGISTDFTVVVIGTYADAEADFVKPFDNAAAGGVADMTGATMLAAAGGFGSMTPYDVTYDGYTFNFGDALTGQTAADMFVINLSVLGGQDSGTVTIDCLDANWAIIPGKSISINVIPEPMTIALLGLGGLFLLRRRK